MSRDERNVLLTLAGQLTDLLNTRGNPGAADPALQRLLPDGYRDDPEAAAEFRRFTENSLAHSKTRNARAMIDSIPATETVRLDAQTVQAWLRTLTDIRLTLAVRLGIAHDGDEGADDGESLVLRDVYDWLGFVQGSLLETIDR